MITIRRKPTGYRPRHGLDQAGSVLGLALKASYCQQPRWLCLLAASLVLVIAGDVSHTYSQAKQSSAPPARSQAPPDPNKYALIINGASGEPAYAKQFEEW